jgi:Tfp pilus assembly protein FimV
LVAALNSEKIAEMQRKQTKEALEKVRRTVASVAKMRDRIPRREPKPGFLAPTKEMRSRSEVLTAHAKRSEAIRQSKEAKKLLSNRERQHQAGGAAEDEDWEDAQFSHKDLRRKRRS